MTLALLTYQLLIVIAMTVRAFDKKSGIEGRHALSCESGMSASFAMTSAFLAFSSRFISTDIARYSSCSTEAPLLTGRTLSVER